MKHFKLILIFVLIIVCFNNNLAQNKFGSKISYAWYKATAQLRKTPWIVGLGWNIVDDNGNPYKKIFNGPSLNIFPAPSTLRVEKPIDNGWGAVFIFSYNKYNTGKLINSEVPSNSASNFMSFDLNAKYDFCYLYDINKKWFSSNKKIVDINTIFGYGYTYRNTGRVGSGSTLNIGFGTNLWASQEWGFNLQAIAKFGLKYPFYSTPSNYLQYSFGVIRSINKNSNGRKSKGRVKAVL